MKWYLYLNYYIYSYYRKKKDSPVISSLLITSLLVHVNLFSIHTIYLLLTDFWKVPKLHPMFKVFVILVLSVLVFTQYFLFYYNQKHLKYFREFEINRDKYKHWNFSVKLYIFGSIALCLTTLIIVDLRNHNFELYFLK